MKYTFSAILALVLCMAFVFGCQAPASQQTPSSGLANPMVESNPDEILQKLGVEFLVPEGAEDVRYFIISDGRNAVPPGWIRLQREDPARIGIHGYFRHVL